MDATQEQKFKTLVEDAGALYLGIQENPSGPDLVLFQGGRGESTVALYVFALKTVDDVKLAVKAKRESMQTVAVDGL